MASKPHDADYTHWPYGDQTDPAIRRPTTLPLSGEYLSPEPRSRRNKRNAKAFCQAIVYKINQFLNLILTILFMLLLTRFLLKFFGITTSLFTRWIYAFSSPLVLPFDNLVPILSHGSYHIEFSTLIAIIVYSVTRMLIGKFLQLFVF